jgi:hypothetical protein
MRGCTYYLTVLFLATVALGAQQPQATLQMETANGESTFHIGELIPLKLTFSSPDDTQYQVSPAIGGRREEFDCNRFEVNPATGWSDPLEMYYKQDFILSGHGWPAQPLKKAKPVEASLALNQWVRFDQPGDYTVKVTSWCVFKSPAPGKASDDFRLTRTIKLHIVPATPEWQDAAIKSIRANLDLLDAPAASPNDGDPESWQSRMKRRGQLFEDARAGLRYLATPDAIDEMTSRLREGKYNIEYECSMGLVGLPDSMRQTAIASLYKRIDEPDFPISRRFFSTLEFLNVTPGSNKESIGRQMDAVRPELWSAIFSAVAKKAPVARAQTVQTLLSDGQNISGPAVKQQMTSLLRSSFLDLDSRSQEDDLRDEWDRLDSPEFLPVLQTLARLPLTYPDDFEVGPYTRQWLKAMALMRWYQLDPEGAHSEILAQIGSSFPTLTAQSIAFLPEEQLPQFEPLWAQALLDTKSQLRERALGSLLLRFGTGAATGQMIAKLDAENHMPCDGYDLAMRYLVRFSPDVAKERLKHELATKADSCGGNLSYWMSELATLPIRNDQAVKDLNSPNLQVVRDAIRYLKSDGTAEDEDPLWHRYVQWTTAYKGKANLLYHPGADWGKNIDSWILGEELGDALISGQGWFADPNLIDRVLKRCVGHEMCQRLRGEAEAAHSPYRVNLPVPMMWFNGTFDLWINVAQYETGSLKLFAAKISQFPPGSQFVQARNLPPTSDERKLAQQVRAIIEKHGMTLKIDTH